ncbi:hypothetical protein M2145_002289 [Lachnospiraceae bacterium PF1-21]
MKLNFLDRLQGEQSMLKSEAMIARQYRLQEWAEQIKDCNNRPYKVTVEDWCDANGITKANYYYRLKKVRQAYLANGIDAEEQTSIVQVPIAKTAITHGELDDSLWRTLSSDHL